MQDNNCMTDDHAYELTGGPCKWQINLKFYVAVAADLSDSVGEDQVGPKVQSLIKTLQKSFDKFFNPDKEKKGYKDYTFGKCPCSFQLHASFEALPSEYDGGDADDVAKKLGNHSGIIIVEKTKSAGHEGHAEIGGQVFSIQEESIITTTLPHEIGHILGLKDRYKTGLKGDKNTDATEKQYTGTLMGKKDPKKSGSGKPDREITQEDIDDIVKAVGMTCDIKKCCPKIEEKTSSTTTQEKNSTTTREKDTSK